MLRAIFLFIDQVCNEKFARKDKMREHLRRHQSGTLNKNSTKVYSCRKCQYKSPSQLEYKEHLKTHPAKHVYR